MEKQYEAVKEILEEQIRKITKKGDITPQELENLYKVSAIVLDFETREAMKKSLEHEQGSSQQMGAHAPNGGYSGRMGRGSYNMQSNEGGQSNHYPWYMTGGYYNENSMHNGNSYGPIWNQEQGQSEMQSNRSYTNAYDGTYDGAYDGAYDSSYDGSYENSYRRGRDARTGRYVSRDRGYSRAIDKERMIGKLQDMMDDAPSEKERRTLQQCVDKLERQ